MVGNENALQFYKRFEAFATDRIKQEDGYQEQALVWNDLKELEKTLHKSPR